MEKGEKNLKIFLPFLINFLAFIGRFVINTSHFTITNEAYWLRKNLTIKVLKKLLILLS